MVKFDPKDPLEIIPLTFDFGPYLLTDQQISGTPIVAVSVFTGVDNNPADILSGGISLLGNKVRQNVRNGLVDTEYLIKVTATTLSGLKYTIGRVLPVKEAGTY